MANKSKIFSHPNKPDIERAMGAQESDRVIACRFPGISRECVRRYRLKYFPAELAKARQVQHIDNASDILKRLELELDRLRRVAEAAEDYLRDPENPERYVFGPRGWDIDVVYLDKRDKDHPVKRKTNLQNLLDMLEDRYDGTFLTVNVKYKDPAELLLNAIRSVTPQLKLILEVAVEARKAQADENVEWERIQKVIYDALKAHPKARKAVVDALKTTIETAIGEAGSG